MQFTENSVSVQSTQSSIIQNADKVRKAAQAAQDQAKVVSEAPPEVLKFPTDALPDAFRKIVEVISVEDNVPPDYLVTSMLTIVGAVAGNGYKALVKAGYEVSPILWTCLVGGSGKGKSPALRFATKPLDKINAELVAKTQEKRNELDERIRQYEALDKDGKAQTPDPRKEEAPDYLIKVDDYTREALVHTLTHNPGGVFVEQDEFVSFLAGMNQYRAGTDRQFFLSSYDNKSWTHTRKGEGSKIIPKLFFPILGGTQPAKLPELAKGDGESDGFMHRICFAYADGHKKQALNIKTSMQRDQAYQAASARYDKYIQRLGRLRKMFDDDYPLKGEDAIQYTHYAPDAIPLVVKYSEMIAERINHYDESGDGFRQSMYAKSENLVHRIAFILELMRYASTTDYTGKIEICKASFESAERIAEYFRYSLLRTRETLREARIGKRVAKNTNLTYKDLFEPGVVYQTGQVVSKITEHIGVSERTAKRKLDEYFESTGHGKWKLRA